MKKVILKSFLAVLGLSFLFTLFSPTKLFAAEDMALNEKVIEIFISDDCEFCDELKTELNKTYESSSYALKNIDTSDTNLKNFNIALVACGREEGTVPMFLNGNVCVSGKDLILETFKEIAAAKEIKTVAEADGQKADIITSAYDKLSEVNLSEAIQWYDIAIGIAILVLLIVGIFLFIKNRSSQDKKKKLVGSGSLVVMMMVTAGFLFTQVNSVNSLSSTGADAAGKASNCLATNSCKDWNEFVNAKAENAKNEGRHEDSKYWAEKEVDQNILNAQIQSEYNALVDTLKSKPREYCGADYNASTCTVVKYLELKLEEAKNDRTVKSICSADKNSTECKKAEANTYLNTLYGYDVETGYRGTGNELGGKMKDAIEDYKIKKLAEAYDALESEMSKLSSEQRQALIAEGRALCAENNGKGLHSGETIINCTGATAELILKNFAFKFIETDNYTGMGVFVLNRPVTSTDECLVATSGGACPVGTATCICQKTPVERAVCAGIGQNCQAVCQATHNVCVNCSSRVITEEEIENPPPTTPPPNSTAVCQESCSETTPCNDGTSCVNGRCINASCPEDSDCMCNTTTPICGDGIINDSPQAPEQCELGNPPGTSCDWNTCNQNSCTCPDTNPNWDIEKTSSVICVNENTVNASAQVKFNISATYINEDAPTEVGVLERVVDRPQNYLASWLDTGSISNGGTHTTDGDLVDEIRWDLTGELSQFTIPSGQTEVTKTNFLSYTFNLPKAYFGRYVNLVTGYPNQENDDNSFSYTHSVYIGCNVPSTSTSLTPQNLAKIFVGVFIVLVGLMFALSQAGNSTIEGVVNSSAYTKIQLFLTPKAKRDDVAQEQFERKVLRKK